MKSFCCCCGKRTPFQAVSDVWYHIDSNHLFCLLGHNGAGKVRARTTHTTHTHTTHTHTHTHTPVVNS
jgi:ABC-type multidrug transport system ATPase subunit